MNERIGLCVLTALALTTGVTAQTVASSYAGTRGGTYTAAQGITRVVLVIEAVNERRIRGHFLFYADRSNPDVPSGRYTIAGSVDSTSG